MQWAFKNWERTLAYSQKENGDNYEELNFVNKQEIDFLLEPPGKNGAY